MSVHAIDLARSGMVLTLDVFDTALARQLDQPDDVYNVLEHRIADALGIPLPRVAGLRRRAENEVRQAAWARGEREVTLEDIHKRMVKLLGVKVEVVSRLSSLETELESALLVPREEVRELYRRVMEGGGRACFLTDTFFPEAFVATVLERSGYASPLVIASSKHGKTKSYRGELFHAAARRLGVEDVREFLHVGDNLVSDVRVPSSLGVRVWHFPAERDVVARSGGRFRQTGSAWSGVAQGLVNRRWASEEVDLESLGYGVLGPLWLGFVPWVLSRAKRDMVDQLFFLSRDGYCLKETAQKAFGEGHSYLHVSRHVLYLAFVHVDFEEALNLLSQNYSGLTFRQALERIGLEVGSEGGRGDWWLNHLERVISGAQDVELFKGVLVARQKDLKAVAAQMHERLGGYLKGTGILSGRRIGLVDLGWHGSLQKVLRALLDGFGFKGAVSGYYLGLFEQAKVPEMPDTAEGYLCTRGEPLGAQAALREGPSVIELLHSAPHGSVIGFEDERSRYQPILQDRPGEVSQYRDLVAPMHEGARRFIADVLDLGEMLGVPIDTAPLLRPGEAAANLFRLLSAPRPAEVALLGGLTLSPDFGLNTPEVPLAGWRGRGVQVWPAGTRLWNRLKVPAWFDEAKYLAANPDVDAAVSAGRFESGYDHYLKFGVKEWRKISEV